MPFQFRNHLDGEERADYFALIVFLTFCDCSVALPHGAKGWSAVCDCGISVLYSLFSHPHRLIR